MDICCAIRDPVKFVQLFSIHGLGGALSITLWVAKVSQSVYNNTIIMQVNIYLLLSPGPEI